MSSYYNYIVKPKLNKILKQRNMTQKDLADLTGISQAAISRFDRNAQHIDSYLVAISRALNLTIEDLFDIDEQLEIDLSLDE
jgi:transcriptional regulator with XRE-family HTH domain